MTTILDQADPFASVLNDARTPCRKQPGDGVTTRWFDGDVLDEGAAWIEANSDILPQRMDASWRQMDNGPLLTLVARDAEDPAIVLSAAYALSARFDVTVSTYRSARLGTVGVSVGRIRTNGFKVGGMAVDFSGSALAAGVSA